jgi:multisubunit Na+/H+ antiporter MnhC subunit
MGLYITDQGKRSKLQERVAAELRQKMSETEQTVEPEMPDGVEDSRYIKDYQKSRPIPRGAVLAIVIGVALFICVAVLALVG